MLRRWLSNLAAGASLLLCVAVCVLWVRGRVGHTDLLWSYDRWLPDGGAASNYVELAANRQLWLTIGSGRVGAPTGSLVWGYYLNAEQSGGHPRLTFNHDRYDAYELYLLDPFDHTPGWGPLRWSRSTRTAARDGDDHSTVSIGVSYWLAAFLLAVLPARAAWRVVAGWRRRRALRRAGSCRRCGYDLRASPERCPECGEPRGPAGAPGGHSVNSSAGL